MKTPTLKEIRNLTPGTLIPMCSGKITAISDFSRGTHEGIMWSLQNIMLSDDTGEMPVKVGNHDEIPQDWLGKNLLILAHKKLKGGLSGVKLDEEEYQEGGLTKKFRQISIAKSGELVLQNGDIQEEAAEQPEEEAKIDPAVPVHLRPPVSEQPQPVKSEPEPVSVPVAVRATELRYERTINTGNYCSEKIGLTMEIPAGVKAVDALRTAQAFIEKYGMKEVAPIGAKPLQ